ncbi:MAG: helix-turn-helix transcriptional regulator [Clostridium sp.]|nr:helix-turn-helix transcriptional regulator [Clostridium sp.]
MNLRELRKSKGIQRQYASEKIGICGKHLNDIEGGRVNLTDKVAKKFSELYQLDIKNIFEMYKEGRNNE